MGKVEDAPFAMVALDLAAVGLVILVITLVLDPRVWRLRNADFEPDAFWYFFLRSLMDVLGNHLCGGFVTLGQHLVEDTVIESPFQHVTFGPAQGAEVSHHDGVGAVLGSVELAGSRFDADFVGVAMHTPAGAIVVADEVCGVKGEFG